MYKTDAAWFFDENYKIEVMRQIYINESDSGQRLDKLLKKYMPDIPLSLIYKMLRKKNIVLNSKKADGSERLCAGDNIKLWLSDEFFEKSENVHKLNPIVKKQDRKVGKMYEKDMLTAKDIVYEDADIIMINKPVGVLSQKAASGDISVNELLINYLIKKGAIDEEKFRLFRPSACSRLDRNTSGLLICAKTYKAAKKMSTLIKERQLDKRYVCIVKGIVNEKKVIKGWLYKDGSNNKVKIVTAEFPDSKYIETEYTPLRSLGGMTLLEVRLITGRTHQIRAHLASIGHQIVGDNKYFSSKSNEDTQDYNTKDINTVNTKAVFKKYGFRYQLLHSYTIKMPDITGEFSSLSGRTFTAPMPEIFEKIMPLP